MSDVHQTRQSSIDDIEILRLRVRELERERDDLRWEFDRLRAVADGVADGLWDCTDLSSDRIWCSPRFATLLGHEVGEFKPSRELIAALLHPDDRRLGAFEPQAQAGDCEPCHVECRLRTKTGQYRWFHVRWCTYYDDAGKAVRMAGSLRDVADHKQTAELVARQAERLRLLMRATRDAVFDVDLRAGTVWRNSAYRDRFGAPREAHMDDTWWRDHLHPDDQQRVIGIENDLLTGGKEEVECEYRLRRPDGEYAHVLSRLYAARDEKGQPIRLLGSLVDITKRIQAQEALRASEETHRLAMEATSDGLWDWNCESGEVRYGPAWARILGESHVAPHYHSWESRLHPDDREPVLKSLGEHLEGKTDFWQAEHRLRTAGGDWKWVLSRGRVVSRDHDGRPLRMVGTNLDVHEKRTTEEALRTSVERYCELVDNMASGVAVYQVVGDAEDFVFIDINPAGARTGKRAREDHIGRRVQELYPGVRDSGLLDVFRRVWHTGKADRHALSLYQEERLSLWVDNYVTRLPSGEIVAIYQDVTERKRAEQALRESEEKLRNIVEHSTNLFYSHDTKHVLTYLSPQSEQVLGYPPDEAMRRWTDFVTDHPANARGFELTQRAIETGQAQPPYELQIRHRTGRLVWTEVRERPIVEDGKTVGIVGALTDITERKQAEEELRRSEQEKSLILNTMTELLAVYDTDLRILWANKAAGEAAGQSAAALVGRKCYEILHGLTAPCEDCPVLRAIETGAPHEQEMCFSNGCQWFLRAYPIHDQNGNVSGAIELGLDIAQRKRAEQETVRNAEELRAVYDGAPIVMILVDKDRRVRKANRAAADAGPAPSDLVGLHGGEVLRCVHALNNPGGCGSGPDCAACRIRALVQDALDNGTQHHRVEAQLRVQHGDTLVSADVLVSCTPLALPDGPYVLITIEDITARKELEAQLRQSQKMEAVGQLAGGIAHDFNNILTAILGNVELLRSGFASRLAEGDALWEAVDEIDKASHRAAALTRQLLAFGRKQLLRPTVIDFAELLTETDAMLRRLIREDIDLSVACQPDTWLIKADPGQVQQVIINLVVNARDAMPDGGQLQLRAANATLTRRDTDRLTEALPGRYVVLEVSDTGAGMEEETLRHLFEPFFTTKEMGQGTGLGLATVHGIVQQLGGHITVESHPGRGATFHVYWPAVFDEKQAWPEAEQSSGAVDGNETVLVCEDDQAVRDLTVQTLAAHGYKVLSAADPRRAIEVANLFDGPIHGLITDVIMPGMNGRQLAEKLTARRRQLRVLYVTGYASGLITPADERRAHGGVLHKPYSPRKLLQGVRDLFDRNQ